MILILCLAAEVLVSLLPITFPSSVAAILLLAFLLGMKIWREEQIKETADFMLSNMAVVFVPLAIGMVEDIGLIKGQILGFVFVVVVSLIVTFLGTYATVRAVQRIMKSLSGRGGDQDESDRV